MEALFLARYSSMIIERKIEFETRNKTFKEELILSISNFNTGGTFVDD